MKCAQCRFIKWELLDNLNEHSATCNIKFPPWMNLPLNRVVFPDDGAECDFGEPQPPEDNLGNYSWR